MPKRKKTTASDELVMVKSVRRTRSRRMKFCVQRGLGGIPQQAAPGSRGYPWALLADFVMKQINKVLLEQKRPIGAEKTFQVCYDGYCKRRRALSKSLRVSTT